MAISPCTIFQTFKNIVIGNAYFNKFVISLLVILSSSLGANQLEHHDELSYLVPSDMNEHAARPKIYDCFTFFNELEILEIKLNELYDHVDYFVLVESTETFRGTPKPLYFAENKDRFSKFLDKIIYVPLTQHLETSNPWDREFYQRNQLLRGLTNCLDTDIVIIEDLDEIISAAKLPEFIEPILTHRLPYVTCKHAIYTYYLNRLGHAGGSVLDMLGSIVTSYGEVKRLSPQGIRNLISKENSIAAGWHFTSMGGADRVRKKLESFSHSELDNEAYKHYDRIRQDVEALRIVPIDESYPQFVRDNIPYFKELGFIDE
jgi:hypothetical protein